jgi:hypothetical protein
MKIMIKLRNRVHLRKIWVTLSRKIIKESERKEDPLKRAERSSGTECAKAIR